MGQGRGPVRSVSPGCMESSGSVHSRMIIERITTTLAGLKWDAAGCRSGTV